jgi:2-methylcitrate dehydratase PrpD
MARVGIGIGRADGGVVIVAATGAAKAKVGCIDRKKCVKVLGLAGEAQQGLTRSAVAVEGLT